MPVETAVHSVSNLSHGLTHRFVSYFIDNIPQPPLSFTVPFLAPDAYVHRHTVQVILPIPSPLFESLVY